MFCKNCGKQVEAGQAFCPNCGSKISYEDEKTEIFSNNQTSVQQPAKPAAKGNNKVMLTAIISAAMVIIVAIVCAFMFLSGNKTEKESEDEEDIELTEVTKAEKTDQHQYDWLSERKVTAADLSGISAGDLRLMRNAMFAKHGYKFKSDDLKEYFANFSWYEPKYADVTSMLTPTEKYNIEFIKKFEGKGDSGKSTGSLKNIGFSQDYSDYVCYTWLDDSDVAGLSKSELRILRNTIYARHGRKFQSADLRNYFNGFSWYNPRYDEIPISSLSDTEQHNIKLIQKYE